MKVAALSQLASASRVLIYGGAANTRWPGMLRCCIGRQSSSVDLA